MRKTLFFLLLIVSIVVSAQEFTYTAVGGNFCLEAEQTWRVTDYKSCTLNPRSLAADSISKGAYLDIMATGGNANWTMTYRLNSALSGTCDLHVVVLPKTIQGPDGNKRPCKFDATINYIDDDGNAATYKCGTFITDPYCVDTVKIATFTFPASNLNQANGRPSLTLTCNITAKENSKYNREMYLDCVLLQPLESIDRGTLSYNILDKEAKTCEVSANPDWLGDLFIPEKVQYGQSEYTVTAIGDNAFTGCTDMAEVNIPASVTKIGNAAFEGCISMTGIDIPTSVTEIGDNAFTGCTGLRSVDIPASVTKIGNGAFQYCDNLTEVNIHDIAAWCSINFGDASSNPMYYAKTLKLNGEEIEITNLVIPASVTEIGSYAFMGFKSLTSVDIPASVTKIGDWAFHGCTGLTEVNIHDIAAWCNINFGTSSSNPMYYAKTLKLNGEEIEITNFVIPASVTEIGSYAFMGFTSLTSVDIPSSVTKIGDGAFHGCTGLTEVNIHDIAAWCSINFGNVSSNPMYYAKTLKLNGEEIEITNFVIPASVTEIGSCAFMGFKSLTSVDIPTSVTKIGSEAFTGCIGLTEVNIHDITAWCNINFGTADSNPMCQAKALKLNGEEITNLVIPASVTTIGDYAFYNCKGLTSVDIPTSVTKIGIAAFGDCSGLIEVNIHDIAAWCSINFGNISSNPMYYAKTLKLNGEEIGITNLVIPSSVTEIGNCAFMGFTSLTSVDIPSSVTKIGDWAFHGCTGLTEVNIHDITAWCNINFGTADSNPMCQAKALKLNGEEITNLVIPSSVTAIGDYAFEGCTGLISVDIPNSVTKIGKYAFEHCSGLTEINIPASVTNIGIAAFSLCSGLTEINIPNSVTKIENGTFWHCTGMSEVNIPASVTKIGNAAFEGCISMTGIDIPTSVTEIGDYAFYNCKGLTSVDIPASVTEIGSYAFTDCTGMSEVNIPASVTNIGDWAFRDCTSLTSVDIPNSVTKIGREAFAGCIGLKTIYSLNPTPPTCNYYYDPFFEYTHYQNATLYVPQEAVEAYRRADIWRYFQNIVGIDVTEVTNINAPNNNADRVYYDMSGRRLNTPIKGLNIINGKKVILR